MSAFDDLSDAARAMQAADNHQLEALSEVSHAIASGLESMAALAMTRLSARNVAATEARRNFLAALDKARLAYAERDR